MEKSNEQVMMHISRNSIIGNIFLATFKMIAGIVAHSAAMMSDAVHSLSDIASTIVVMIGVKMANQKADKEHPYGHERFECVSAIVLSAMLFATGIGIGWVGLQNVLSSHEHNLETPGVLALVAAVTSIVVKEGMYWYTMLPAKRMQSSAMMADAWHHRSDALSSVGSFIGIAGARLGYPVLDSLASIVICFCILKAAMDIFRDAIGKMTDKACDEETVGNMRQVILLQPSVAAIDELKTRLFGDKIYVDVEICTDGATSLSEAHDVAESVHEAIEREFPKVKHCMVHVSPYIADQPEG